MRKAMPPPAPLRRGEAPRLKPKGAIADDDAEPRLAKPQLRKPKPRKPTEEH